MKRPAVSRGAFVLIAIFGWLHAPLAHQAPVPPTPAPVAAQSQAAADSLTVAAGERLLLELESSLHTRSSRQGEQVYFRTAEDLRVGNEVAVPRDSKVHATVTKVRRPGRLKGRAEIRIRFDNILLSDGTSLALRASVLRAGFARAGKAKDGEPQIKGEAGSGGNIAVIAQGGLQGAILGTMTSSARGIAYGSAVGAAMALASILFQRGPDLDLPRTTMFEARIDSPIQVPVAAAQRAIAQSNTRGFSPVVSRDPADLPPDAEPTEGASVPRPVLRRNPAGRDQEPPVLTPTPSPDPSPSSTVVHPPTRPTGSHTTGTETGSYKVSVDVQLVVVEAVVRDRGGRLIDNLKPEDFRIFENGAEQTIRNYSRDELPLAIALVVDRSGSVAPFMPELRESAYRTLSQLKRGDEVALFTFAGDVQRLEDLTRDRQRVADRIADIRAGGGTNIVDAIFESVYYLGMVAPDRRRAVILISDNQATVRPRASEAQTIRMALETETVVYSIKTSGERMPVMMRIPNLLMGAGSVSRITEETGGETIDMAGLGSISAALDTALSRLRMRYTLGYYPAEPFRDRSFRGIEVRLGERFGQPGADYTVHARRGYYPPSNQRTEPNRP